MSRVNESALIVRTNLPALADDDLDAAIELLHPDVEWRNTGLPTLRGKRVRAAISDMTRRKIDFAVEIHHIAADGGVVLTDRTDELAVGPVRTTFWVRGTFELTDGLIRVWDDAFNWGGLAAGFFRRQRLG